MKHDDQKALEPEGLYLGYWNFESLVNTQHSHGPARPSRGLGISTPSGQKRQQEYPGTGGGFLPFKK